MTAIILAVIVFLLTVTAIVCMHSALQSGRALQQEIKRVTEGRDRR